MCVYKSSEIARGMRKRERECENEKVSERERKKGEREGESLIYLYGYVYPLVEATKRGYTSPSDAVVATVRGSCH